MMRPWKWLKRGFLLLLCISAFVGIAFLLNAAPKVPPVVGTAEETNRPMLVKIHAQWCPVCLASKRTWSKLQTTYGDRVDLVIFDITSQKTSEASRIEAEKYGLKSLFDQHSREPGAVLVLERGSRRLKSSIPGLSNWSAYSDAVEEALKAP